MASLNLSDEHPATGGISITHHWESLTIPDAFRVLEARVLEVQKEILGKYWSIEARKAVERARVREKRREWEVRVEKNIEMMHQMLVLLANVCGVKDEDMPELARPASQAFTSTSPPHHSSSTNRRRKRNSSLEKEDDIDRPKRKMSPSGGSDDRRRSGMTRDGRLDVDTEEISQHNRSNDGPVEQLPQPIATSHPHHFAGPISSEMLLPIRTHPYAKHGDGSTNPPF